MDKQKKYKANFWVYKNWNSKNTLHAYIHVPWCGNCNDGDGKQGVKESIRGEWCDCDTYEEAREVLKKFKREYNCNDVRDCGACNPGLRPLWYEKLLNIETANQRLK